MADQSQDPLMLEEEQEITIPAMMGARRFRSFDPQTLEPVETGSIAYTDYDATRDLRTMQFFRNSDGRAFKLGSASGRFKMIDHVTAAQGVMELGFEPSMIKIGRGGARAFLTMSHPELPISGLNIGWDEGLYEDQDPGKMFFSIGMMADARAGRGFHYTAGIFRLICINGLVSKTLGMGDAHWSHRTFNPDNVQEWASSMLQYHADDGQVSLKLERIPTLAVEWPREIIRKGAELGGDELVNFFKGYPDFVVKPLRTLLSLPDWAQVELSEQMGLIQENTDRFTRVDLLNALTNVGNAQGTGNRVYFNLDRWMNALLSLVLIGAFKNDINISVE